MLNLPDSHHAVLVAWILAGAESSQAPAFLAADVWPSYFEGRDAGVLHALYEGGTIERAEWTDEERRSIAVTVRMPLAMERIEVMVAKTR